MSDTLNIFRRHRSDLFDKLVYFPPPGTDRFSLPEQHRMTEVGVLFKDMGGFHLILCSLQLLLCRRIGLETFDFLMKGFLDRFRLLAWADESVEIEKSRIGL